MKSWPGIQPTHTEWKSIMVELDTQKTSLPGCDDINKQWTFVAEIQGTPERRPYSTHWY